MATADKHEPTVHSTLCIGYNIVCSGLCECNEHDPLQTML